MGSVTKDSVSNIVCLEFHGDLTAREILEFITQELGNHPEPAILDFSDGCLGDIPVGEWKDLLPAAQKALKSKKKPCALVSSCDLHFGMLRMLEILNVLESYNLHFRVYQNVDEASHWLRSLR